jgi:hypothetical protein
MMSDTEAPFQVTSVTISAADVLAGIAGDPYQSPLAKSLDRDYGMRDIVVGVAQVFATDGDDLWWVADLPAGLDDSAPGEITLVFTQKGF